MYVNVLLFYFLCDIVFITTFMCKKGKTSSVFPVRPKYFFQMYIHNEEIHYDQQCRDHAAGPARQTPV